MRDTNSIKKQIAENQRSVSESHQARPKALRDALRDSDKQLGGRRRIP